ncbi:C40 family peptidase [Lysobacter enzymogenes]|uniref:C40 family peptidase n=1 Tax=Lysobacter enzymogenes TaxID=69 RepID=UPI001A95B09B|nr:NlpC/P60 family protein [Lysobacter enzymogenes]QQP96486.1 C40 family peptidase [Lysobacter enzymogenes]QQP96554.1 C40 family peptidase [Lysobacter enzymogenes]
MTALPEAARGYLGSPFRHQGRSRSGLDCVGLVVLALADQGRAVADVTTYGRDPHHGLLEQHLVETFGPAIARTDLHPGDIVAIEYSGATRHVAIVGDYPGGGLSLIHTDQTVGRVTEHRLDSRWHRRITGAWRP